MLQFRVLSCAVVLLGALLLVPVSAQAEFLRIELKIFGMDCATCAHGVSVAMKKLEGVESVELSLNRSVADLRLREGNRVTLDQLRTVIKRNGFTPKEAAVTAIGSPAQRDRGLVFEVSGILEILAVASVRSARDAVEQLAGGSAKPGIFEITGTVERKDDGSNEIAIAKVTPRR